MNTGSEQDLKDKAHERGSPKWERGTSNRVDPAFLTGLRLV
jgi:hypothetical protein